MRIETAVDSIMESREESGMNDEPTALNAVLLIAAIVGALILMVYASH